MTHTAGGGNSSIIVEMFVCVYLARKNLSEREFFIPTRKDLGVKLWGRVWESGQLDLTSSLCMCKYPNAQLTSTGNGIPISSQNCPYSDPTSGNFLFGSTHPNWQSAITGTACDSFVPFLISITGPTKAQMTRWQSDRSFFYKFLLNLWLFSLCSPIQFPILSRNRYCYSDASASWCPFSRSPSRTSPISRSTAQRTALRDWVSFRLS